MTMVIDVYFNN